MEKLFKLTKHSFRVYFEFWSTQFTGVSFIVENVPSHRRALEHLSIWAPEQCPFFFSFQVESHQRRTHPRLLICAISIPCLSPHQATESQQRPYFLSSCEIVETQDRSHSLQKLIDVQRRAFAPRWRPGMISNQDEHWQIRGGARLIKDIFEFHLFFNQKKMWFPVFSRAPPHLLRRFPWKSQLRSFLLSWI